MTQMIPHVKIGVERCGLSYRVSYKRALSCPGMELHKTQTRGRAAVEQRLVPDTEESLLHFQQKRPMGRPKTKADKTIPAPWTLEQERLRMALRRWANKTGRELDSLRSSLGAEALHVLLSVISTGEADVIASAFPQAPADEEDL